MTRPTVGPAGDVSLLPLVVEDFPLIRDLAERVWRETYTGMIPAAQIDFMLAGRFADAALAETIAAPGRWLELLRLDGTPVGYCGCEIVAAEPDALKLGQLYLLAARRGRGLGRFMLERVVARARALGKRSITLQVNKRNHAARAFYLAHGFVVRDAAVFDIGAGFVMDDHLLERRLPVPEAPPAA